MNAADRYWLAGLLEGEGCFTHESPGNGRPRRPAVLLSMTDQDVVERAARRMGTAAYSYDARTGNRLQWRARLRGEAATTLMRELLPCMGIRRTAKIKEVLSA